MVRAHCPQPYTHSTRLTPTVTTRLRAQAAPRHLGACARGRGGGRGGGGGGKGWRRPLFRSRVAAARAAGGGGMGCGARSSAHPAAQPGCGAPSSAAPAALPVARAAPARAAGSTGGGEGGRLSSPRCCVAQAEGGLPSPSRSSAPCRPHPRRRSPPAPPAYPNTPRPRCPPAPAPPARRTRYPPLTCCPISTASARPCQEPPACARAPGNPNAEAAPGSIVCPITWEAYVTRCPRPRPAHERAVCTTLCAMPRCLPCGRWS